MREQERKMSCKCRVSASDQAPSPREPKYGIVCRVCRAPDQVVVDKFSVAGIKADRGDERCGEIAKRGTGALHLMTLVPREGAIHAVKQGRECQMHIYLFDGLAAIIQ